MATAETAEQGGGDLSLPKLLDNDKAVLLGVALNIISGVGVVLLNKYLYTVDGFRYMVTLSAIHFLITWGSTRALAAARAARSHAPAASC